MSKELREHLTALLVERGVSGVDELVVAFEDADLNGALATVAYYDDAGSKGTGLLVHLLRQREHFGYRRPGERAAIPARQVTDGLLSAIRGSCHSPDGFCREEARGLVSVKAKRLGIDPDALIDAAMGEDWQETPVHPALGPAGSSREFSVRYARWVAGVA